MRRRPADAVVDLDGDDAIRDLRTAAAAGEA